MKEVHMLNYDEITKLAKIKADDKYYLSCYLNVDPVENARGDYLIHFKNMLKKASENLAKDIRRQIMPDIRKIDSYIGDNKRDFKKGLAIISSAASDFWWESHFSTGFKNEIVVDKLPYIKPLLNMIDTFRRYAVMIIDKESGRLFAVHLGEIEEYREIYTDNVPGKHKKGGWFSLAERSFERHIDYHVELHIKDVIKQLEHLLESGDITRLVIGGTEEALSMAKSLFPRHISGKIIGTFSVTMSAPGNEVLLRVTPVIEAYERKEKEETMELLMTKTMKNENAVLGIDNVLSALQEGRVMKLLFVKDYKTHGFSCTRCGFLTSQMAAECPYCKNPMQKVDYMIELAAQKAIEQGAAFEVVHDNKAFEKAGAIGAFLRY
jgi:peptide chain release factor subunit 1